MNTPIYPKHRTLVRAGGYQAGCTRPACRTGIRPTCGQYSNVRFRPISRSEISVIPLWLAPGGL
eukprot:scaffold648596_cov56-Prasinocladus_malaysianus.AAC.1